MIRRPPRSTQSRSSAASDVYKRQFLEGLAIATYAIGSHEAYVYCRGEFLWPVSYTHLRAHETKANLVCRLLLEKKKKKKTKKKKKKVKRRKRKKKKTKKKEE